MADPSKLEMLAEPHDTLRLGLSVLKDDASVSHPVETIQNSHQQQRTQTKSEMMKSLYGSGLPARLHIERQILERVQRLPGIASSRLGLESMTGELDEFAFESYLGQESEVSPPDLHAQMESHLGMRTKPVTRGFI